MPRVLLVEDEPGLVMTLTDRLAAEGYEVGLGSRRRDGTAAGDDRRLRPRPARRHAPGARRLRCLPHAAAAEHHDADPDAHRARAGGRSCRRAQAGRRRLSREAVRDGRAAGEDRGAAAPRAAERRRRPRRTSSATCTWTSGRPRSPGRGQPLEVSAREFKLLKYFIEHRGATLSRDELLNEVWGYNAMPSTRTVDVHVAWLRQKLEGNPRRARVHPHHSRARLQVHGVGHRSHGPGAPAPDHGPRRGPYELRKHVSRREIQPFVLRYNSRTIRAISTRQCLCTVRSRRARAQGLGSRRAWLSANRGKRVPEEGPSVPGPCDRARRA